MLKMDLCAQTSGMVAINRHTTLPILTFHVKGIEYCFGHHRISNNTVVT